MVVNGRQAPVEARAQVRLIAKQVYVAPRIQGNFLASNPFEKNLLKKTLEYHLVHYSNSRI